MGVVNTTGIEYIVSILKYTVSGNTLREGEGGREEREGEREVEIGRGRKDTCKIEYKHARRWRGREGSKKMNKANYSIVLNFSRSKTKL